MDVIGNFFIRALNYLRTIGISDCLDILIVAFIVYRAIWFIKTTNSYNLAKGLVFFLLLIWFSDIFNLNMINFMLKKAVELGAIALVVLFQPELRSLLEKTGRKLSRSGKTNETVSETAIKQTVISCTQMSASLTGALIVFERKVKLDDIAATGTILNADPTAELIKNLFYNKAPLHDGAVIMRGGKILAAGCVLPLTDKQNLNKELGMRHRAGIGMSEKSDAVVVIVSEETGSISVAVDGSLKRHRTGPELDALLREELSDTAPEQQLSIMEYLKKLLLVTNNEQ